MWDAIIGIGLGLFLLISHFFVLPRFFQGMGFLPREYPREREEENAEQGAEERDEAE